jgi:hypothetical protein
VKINFQFQACTGFQILNLDLKLKLNLAAPKMLRPSTAALLNASRTASVSWAALSWGVFWPLARPWWRCWPRSISTGS